MSLPVPASSRSLELVTLADNAREFISASRAANTTRSYQTGWAQFEGWCEQHGRTALPAAPETLVLFVADLAKRVKAGTIDARLAAVSAAHRAAGYDSPTKAEAVRLVRRGIRRTIGVAQRQARPVLVDDLRRMVADLPDDPGGCRDRALLLVGFAGALRRSELVGLDVDDIADGADGLTVRIRRSKTDPEGAGRMVGLPYGSNPSTCPVRAWRRWLDVSGISEGPAFRPVTRHGHIALTRLGDRAVSDIVKKHAARVGIDPATMSGHSLRAGLATAAAAAGVPERVIAATTGHRGTTMLRKYIRTGTLFKENAASFVGL